MPIPIRLWQVYMVGELLPSPVAGMHHEYYLSIWRWHDSCHMRVPQVYIHAVGRIGVARIVPSSVSVLAVGGRRVLTARIVPDSLSTRSGVSGL